MESKSPGEVEQADEHIISVDELQNLCRTCLGKTNLSNISQVEYKDGTTLIELFKKYFEIDVEQSPTLPQNICMQCTYSLFNFYSLSLQVVKFENVFRQMVEEDNAVKMDEFAGDNKFEILTEEDDDDDEGGAFDEDILHTSEEPSEDFKNVVPKKEEDDLLFKLEEPSCSKPNTEDIADDHVEEEEDTNSDEDISEFTSGADLKAQKKETHQKKAGSTATTTTRTMIKCDVCNRMVLSSKMNQHKRVHTGEKPYECKTCHQAFTAIGNLKRHEMIHTGERPHVCKICGKGFIQSTSLTQHESGHKPGEILSDMGSQYVCPYCDVIFRRYNPYREHIRQHKEIQNEPITEADIVDREQPFVCNTCGRRYKSKGNLATHMVTHGDRKFLCNDCGKEFFTKAELFSHAKVHTKEKPYKCDICDKQFSYAGTFKSHKLIHAGHRPYGCSQCPKRFVQITHLKTHLKTHTGEKPFNCAHCGKAFAAKGNMLIHSRQHTGDKPYNCMICGTRFKDSKTLKKHLMTHKPNDTQPELEEIPKIKEGRD